MGTVIGGALGVIVGLAYEYPAVHIITLFLILVWGNKCEAWSGSAALAKAFFGFSALLGSMWPVVTKGLVTGWVSYVSIISITAVPFLITGALTLFPFPALAINSSRVLVGKICNKLSIVSTAALRGFSAQDFVSLYSAEIKNVTVEIMDNIEVLETLHSYTLNEVILFPTAKDFPAKLHQFILFSKILLNKLKSLHDMLQNIVLNHTHDHFISSMYIHLGDYEADISIVLRLLYEEMNDVQVVIFPFNFCCWAWLKKILGIFETSEDPIKFKEYRHIRRTAQGKSYVWQDSEVMVNIRLGDVDIPLVHASSGEDDASSTDDISDARRRRMELLKDAVARMNESQKALLDSYASVRKKYVWKKAESLVQTYRDMGHFWEANQFGRHSFRQLSASAEPESPNSERIKKDRSKYHGCYTTN